jgi:hypothetical protein
MNQSKTKNFKFYNAAGTVNVCPVDKPSMETKFGQPVEICFVGTDTDGSMIGRIFNAAPSIQKMPEYMVGRLLSQMFQLFKFETHGAIMVELDRDDDDNDRIHIHGTGIVAPFDVDQWNHDSTLTSVLLECKIKSDPTS